MNKSERNINRVKKITKWSEEMSDDFKVTIETYLKNKEGEYNWLFNWKGGGFNDVWAKTEKQAISKVKAQCLKSKKDYPTHVLLVANEKSFRKATRDSANERIVWAI